MTTPDQSFQLLHKKLIEDGTFKSCLNCEHWSENVIGGKGTGANYCEKYNQAPPPEILVFACPEWAMDIPF